MLLYEAQRADVCEDEAHFSTGDGGEDEDIIVRVLVWRQKHRHRLWWSRTVILALVLVHFLC